jgi:hypothetical protein
VSVRHRSEPKEPLLVCLAPEISCTNVTATNPYVDVL